MGCRLSKPKKEKIVNAVPDNRHDLSKIDDDQITCLIDAEWKFYKSDLKDMKKVAKCGKFYYAYNIPGLQYCVVIFPNGVGEECHGEAIMVFFLTGSEERKMVLDLTFSIESANFSECFNLVHEDSDNFGKGIDTSLKFFDSKNKYFVDGILTIRAKGILKAPRPLLPKRSSPISYQWKIKESDLKAMKDSKGILRSKEIDVPALAGTKYYLEICPSKTTRDLDESTAFLYLKTESETKKKIKAVYDFSVVSARVFRGMLNVCEGSDYCGINLCSTKDLFDPTKRLFVNGYLTVNVNGILMNEMNHFIIINCKNDLAPEPQKKKEKDFFIDVGKKHIHVHKQLLIDISPVLAETLETTQIRIKITGFSFKIVDAAMKLCYSCDESFEFTLEDMIFLYRFGDKYRIKLVMDIAEDYLIKDVSPANVVYLIKFSAPDSFNAVKLHQSCLDLLRKYLKESTPIYAMEYIDKDVILKMLSNHPAFDTGV